MFFGRVVRPSGPTAHVRARGDVADAVVTYIKRVVVRAGIDWFDEGSQKPYLIRDTQETKTTWHPIGASGHR